MDKAIIPSDVAGLKMLPWACSIATSRDLRAAHAAQLITQFLRSAQWASSTIS